MTPENIEPNNQQDFQQAQINQAFAEQERLKARIAALEADLELIQKGKEAAERALAYERQQARELAQNGILSVKRDWVALANELAILKNEAVLPDKNETDKANESFREALVIDFTNKLRMGAL